MIWNQKLTPEELAVFDAIVAQCGENLPGWFEYDYMKAQKYLIVKEFFVKCGITLQRQIAIAEQLSNKHIIQMGGIGKYNNHKPNGSSVIWASPREWIDNCAELVRREEAGAYNNQSYTIFMQVDYNTIQYINNNYKLRHTAQLKMDKNCHCIDIRID